MRTRLALAAAATGFLSLLAPLTSWAHGPSRQKVTETIEINAPVDKVWAVIGNFQDMSWHPAVAKTEGSGGNETNAKRTLTLGSGGTIEEQLDEYDAQGHMYHYEITKVDPKVLPVNDYSSKLSVEGEGDKSTVTWWGAFYRGYMNNDPPPELNDEAAKTAVVGVYKAGLEALKAKIEGGK